VSRKITNKTLQQLSSSGQAAQDKRKGNHKERAMAFLDAAVKDHVQDGKKMNLVRNSAWAISV
jgi:hypothetical protein